LFNDVTGETTVKPYRDLSDEEWQMVAPLLPELRPRSELRGRPLANTRAVLNGVLWVMYSGASWSTMPRKYPSYQTCHRRFKAWHESGVLLRIMTELFGPAGESLYALMTSRMRVPAELPFEVAAQTYGTVEAWVAARDHAAAEGEMDAPKVPARRAA
jgi:transposase